jgi:DNA-binding NarL/FixJ family response regulator
MHPGQHGEETPRQTTPQAQPPRTLRADASEKNDKGEKAPRVLIVSASPGRLDELTRAMRQDEVVCGLCQSMDEALSMLPTGERRAPRQAYEVVVCDLVRCSPAALRFVREVGERDVATIILCPDVTFDEAVQAMRAGASDIVSGTIRPRDLQRRVRTLIDQRRAQDRLAMAKSARGETVGRIGGAQRGNMIAAKVTGSGTGREGVPRTAQPAGGRRPDMRDTCDDAVETFERTVRSELDIETLLRQALEFVLAQVGATNAAVFLPGSTGDYSLGAYVNYSCPRETAEILLDHLANVAAPSLDRHFVDMSAGQAEGSGGGRANATPRALHLRSEQAIDAHLGACAEWLRGSEVLASACREGGECLAVIMLFREPGGANPAAPAFNAEAVRLLGLLSAAFARQLARVVRIHHRHLPKDQWGKSGGIGGFMEEGDDEGGMAA